jgi:hypothetical protein
MESGKVKKCFPLAKPKSPRQKPAGVPKLTLGSSAAIAVQYAIAMQGLRRRMFASVPALAWGSVLMIFLQSAFAEIVIKNSIP